MGKYNFQQPANKKKEMPSGWRGIGCILMLILPVFSYFAAVALLQIEAFAAFLRLAMPGLFGTIPIHPLLWRVRSLTPLWGWLQRQPNLLMNLVLGVVVLIFLSGFIGVIYGYMYRAVAPSKYGPTDAPPQKRKGKRKKFSR